MVVILTPIVLMVVGIPGPSFRNLIRSKGAISAAASQSPRSWDETGPGTKRNSTSRGCVAAFFGGKVGGMCFWGSQFR